MTIPEKRRFTDVTREETGKAIPLSSWERIQAARATNPTAEQLNFYIRHGLIKPPPTRMRVCYVGLCSGKVEEVPWFPPKSEFPRIGNQISGPMMNAARAHLSSYSEVREIIVTAGSRADVSLQDLGATVEGLNKLISRLSTRPWFSELFSVELRIGEFTVSHDKQFHVHAHNLVVAKGGLRLPEEVWLRLTEKLEDHFGAVVTPPSRVTCLDGKVQYLFKEPDLRVLNRDEIEALATAIYRKNFRQPSGDFRLFWRDLTKNNLKVISTSDGFCTIDRSKGNIRKPQTEKAAKKHKRPLENYAVRVSHPRAFASNRKEPVVIVINPVGSIDDILQVDWLRELRNGVLPLYLNATAPIVHDIALVDQSSVSTASSHTFSPEAPLGGTSPEDELAVPLDWEELNPFVLDDDFVSFNDDQF